MSTPQTKPQSRPTPPFAPILTWRDIRESLAYVTEPDSKLVLIPSIMEDLKGAAQRSARAFTLTLAVHIAALSDKGYDLPSSPDRDADMT
jgi:hypothetical protein